MCALTLLARKGGTGKTTLAINLSVAARPRSPRPDGRHQMLAPGGDRLRPSCVDVGAHVESFRNLCRARCREDSRLSLNGSRATRYLARVD